MKNHFRKRISPKDFDTAIEFMFAKNPNVGKLMKRLDLRAQVLPDEYITGEELENLSASKIKKQNIMAATAKKNNENLYLTPYDGAFRKWVKEKTETSKERVKSTGDKVNEELFSSVSGKLKKIYTFIQPINVKDVTFLVMYLQEEGEKDATVIQTPFKGSFSQSFLMRLPNLNLKESFELKPYTILNKEKTKEKGKDIYKDYLIPYQGEDDKGKGLKVNAFWSKENTGKLPQIEVVRDKKGDISTVITVERDEFLEDYVILTNKSLSEINANISETKNVADPELAKELADDDLPF